MGQKRSRNNAIDEQKLFWRSETFKNGTLAVLPVLFQLLYTAALSGWEKTFADVTMIGRVEPIIFVIADDYFGRLPARQNERSLKENITRYRAKTVAAIYAKEAALQERESLEVKVRNVRTVMVSIVFRASAKTGESDAELKPKVGVAVRILVS